MSIDGKNTAWYEIDISSKMIELNVILFENKHSQINEMSLLLITIFNCVWENILKRLMKELIGKRINVLYIMKQEIFDTS